MKPNAKHPSNWLEPAFEGHRAELCKRSGERGRGARPVPRLQLPAPEPWAAAALPPRASACFASALPRAHAAAAPDQAAPKQATGPPLLALLLQPAESARSCPDLGTMLGASGTASNVRYSLSGQSDARMQLQQPVLIRQAPWPCPCHDVFCQGSRRGLDVLLG